VDAARRINGIKVVWLSWFTNSLALWQRQDETPYFMDDPTTKVVPPSSSPISDPHQISSDPEPDADDWDQETLNPTTTIELSTINWGDINDEVDAAMNESDSDEDEDTRSDRSGMKSGNVSDEDFTDDAVSVIR
jgi:RNA polymerase II subunit A-like phosphatase